MDALRAPEPEGGPRLREGRGRSFKDRDRAQWTRPRGARPSASRRNDHLPAGHDARRAWPPYKPSFGKDGFVTAGNASGIVDGAARPGRGRRDEARRRALQAARAHRVLGRGGRAAGDHGHRPVPASRKALEAAVAVLEDMDLVEVNEAFAGQYLAVEKELGLDRERTNVNGGAIALGHPLAATGTRLLLTLVHELRRRRAPTAWPPPASAAARASR
jgi:hypothetical protein